MQSEKNLVLFQSDELSAVSHNNTSCNLDIENALVLKVIIKIL